MKVIKIDTVKKDVYELDIEPTLRGMYAALECEIIERIPNNTDLPVDTPHDLWIDEEGLFKEETAFFALLDSKRSNSGYVYRGNGIITGLHIDPDGGQSWLDHSADIKKIRGSIIFLADPASELAEEFSILN